jgi:class 3 adenylate cyclase/tetratricopeptide (TPR) repeat protein
MRCPQCNEENPERARFCLACGRELAEAAAPQREVRKTVTVLFCDVTGSTGLGERLDPESLRRVMSRYFDEMKGVLERHGGMVEKFIGDAIMAVFGIPVLHEDDALRACRAAVEMRSTLASLNEDLRKQWGVEIQVRTGINTGEVVAGDPAAGKTLVTGDTVNVAARLEQAAAAGETLIGHETQRLARDALSAEEVAPLALKGKTEAVTAFRLLDVTCGAPAHARRMDSVLVGREHERRLLHEAFERCLREKACHLFTVLGTAGVGKSRLIAEFVGRVQSQGDVLVGRCLPYGEGITFWPVAEILKQASGVDDNDSREDALAKLHKVLLDEPDAELVGEHLAQVIGLSPASAASEELFWAVRRLLEALARERPQVVIFDDVHWAESTLLDLIEHIADWSRDAPLLLITMSRPELLERRAAWGGGKHNVTTILLEPLSESESVQLVRNLLGETGIPAEVSQKIIEASEGNPLFVEEMVSMLIDDDLLKRVNGRWEPVGDLSQISVPTSVQALLASRLDHLQADERQVLEPAAVVGKVFWRGAVLELLPESARPGAGSNLLTLVRKELIRPERSTFRGEDAFRFRHILIRDAAYQAMPKELRADLHATFAGWLEKRAGDRLAEYEEVLGYHLEQAHRYLGELGLDSERRADLGRRAADALAAGGMRAMGRSDLPAAINLFSRAVQLVPSGGARHVVISVELGAARAAWGDFQAARAVLEEALQGAQALQDRRLEAHAQIELSNVSINAEPEGTTAEAETVAKEALAIFEPQGDNRGQAKAWLLLGMVDLMRCQYDSMQRAVERGAEAARRAGDKALEAENLGWVGAALQFGPTPAQQGLVRFRQLVGETPANMAIERALRRNEAFLLAMQGRFDEAWRAAQRLSTITDELGRTISSVTGLGFISGYVGMWAGEMEAAEDGLRQAYEVLDRVNEKGFLSTIAAELAEVLYRQGRYDEAAHFLEKCRETTASDDIANLVFLGSVGGKLTARKGQLAKAEELAREAVEISDRTDSSYSRGDSRVDLAEVLVLAGKPDEAAAVLEQAIHIYEGKGHVVGVKRARKQLEELGGSAWEGQQDGPDKRATTGRRRKPAK